MKKTKKNNSGIFGQKELAWLMLCISLCFSCTKKYAEYNTNPYAPTMEQMEADAYSAGKNFPVMMNAVLPAGDLPGATDYANSYQVSNNLAADVFSGMMGQAGDWSGNTNNLTYGFNLDWVNEEFNLVGKLMAAWSNVKNVTDVTGDSLQFSVAQLIKINGISRFTDMYGPVPYRAIATGSFTPAYERQDSIYYSFFPELDRAINSLYEGGAAGGKALAKYDPIYGGDYLLWAKYGNSLKLRLAMRMAYADPEKARKYAEEAVSHPAGLISNKAEGALQGSKSTSFAYGNPLFTLTGNYKEARMGAFIQSVLGGYSDPREAVYFKLSTLAGHSAEYVGIRAGIEIDRPTYQPFSELNVSNSTPLPWLLASEVYFLRAEGAIRGWAMAGEAKDLYEEGIKASFDETGASMPGSYLIDHTSVPLKYVDPANSGNNADPTTKITIEWDETAGMETKLERIITQKWIALYLNGQEGWTEFRRTGYPKLFLNRLNKSGGTIPAGTFVRRLPYPRLQFQQNGAQVTRGISLLGGPDNGGTKLWWDKK